MTPETYLTFCLAALALAAVPGPTVTVIIANSLRYGVKAGLANVVGTVAAGLIWVGVAAVGLTATISVMGTWFDILRYAGALYLLWLAYKLFNSDGKLRSIEAAPRQNGSLIAQAFVVTITNPKVLVLFGMIIPPFLTKGGNAAQETMFLGASFVTIACVTDLTYAVLAGSAGTWLSKSRIRTIEITSGLCLAAGAIWMILRGR